MEQEILIGIDLIEVERIKQASRRWKERFLRRIYTGRELALCGRSYPSLAARFAVKEAVAKALGTGIGQISWREIETIEDVTGRPLVKLSGRARERAEELGIKSWAVSLSHTRNMAIAVVVARRSW